MIKRYTRGKGLLEGLLTHLRYKKAKELLADTNRGSILDIGCGSEPYLLNNIDFQKKVGIDRNVDKDRAKNIKIVKEDVSAIVFKQFSKDYFDAVSALAFFEHISSEETIAIFKEVKRILKPDGTFVITVPHKRNDIVLRILSKVKLVSKEEIEEHKQMYTGNMLKAQLEEANFDYQSIGLFELGFNIYCLAKKN